MASAVASRHGSRHSLRRSFVGTLAAFGGPQLLYGALGEDAAILDYPDPVAEGLGDLKNVGGQNTVAPRPTTPRRMSFVSLALAGSRPTVGSSRNRTSGSCNRAAARAVFCRMPWE